MLIMVISPGAFSSDLLSFARKIQGRLFESLNQKQLFLAGFLQSETLESIIQREEFFAAA
ncbi:hypothetical protein [Microbulbifer epialgicus]|uniref:Uncharacterized protein n=1 Tax=Microbulbifer epialgicus TaxID=393907 RepID=A0ABV4NX62_9GAMM